MADIQYARIVGDWRRVVGDEIVSYENTEIGDVGIHGTVTLSPVWARGGPQGIVADPGAYYSIHPVVCRVRYGRLYDPTNTVPYEDVAVEIDGQPLVWKAKFELAFRRRAGEAEVPLQVREVTFDNAAMVAGEIALTGILPASAIPPEYQAYFANAALSATVADEAKTTAVAAAGAATSAASTASSAAGVADAKAAAAAASVTLAAQEADRAIGLATASDQAVADTVVAGGPTTTALNDTYGQQAWADPESGVRQAAGEVFATKDDLTNLPPRATRADAPTDLMQARLDAGTRNLTLAVASDSTLNDSTDGVRVWLANLAPLYPALRIRYGLWSDATKTMQTPLAVLQAGSGTTDSGGPGTVSDSFTRTVAELVGTSADTGQVWAGTAGRWAANGSAAIPTALGDVTLPVGSTGNATVKANVTFDFSGGAAKSVKLLSHYASSQNHLWVQLSTSSAGAVTGSSATVWKRIANVATQIATIPVSLATNGTHTFDMEIGLSALTVTATVAGTSQTATITEGDYAALGGSVGVGTANSGTVGGLFVNSLTVDTPVIPGSVQTLTVYNAATPGKSLGYHATWVADMFPVAPDVVLVSTGHNSGGDSPSTYLAGVDTFIAALHAVHPAALILMASQNPQFPPASTVAAHLARQIEMRPYATRKGYGYVPVVEAYRSRPDGGASFVSADGVHPTTGNVEGSGSRFWSDVFLAHLAAHAV